MADSPHPGAKAKDETASPARRGSQETTNRGGKRSATHTIGPAEAHVATQQAHEATLAAKRAAEMAGLALLRKDERIAELNEYSQRYHGKAEK